MITEQPRIAEILLVEDNENDVILTRKGFERSKLRVNLRNVENGEECMRYLRKEGPYSDVLTPDLILLDLNMPIMDGREVLQELMDDDDLRKIPVVVLTTSSHEGDVIDTYNLKCSSYVVKPVQFQDFLTVVQGLGDFYLTVIVLPNRDEA